MNQLEFLNFLFKTKGDFDICIYNKDKYKTSDGWSKWKKYSEIKSQLKDSDRLYRSILTNEIVLDIENKEYETIKNNLSALNLNFKIYESGGRGMHFHIFFKDLEKLDSSIRPIIKEYIIDYLTAKTGDKLKKSEHNLIGAEFSFHRTTGNQKKIIFETDNEYYKYNELLDEFKNYAITLPEKFVGNVIPDKILPRIVFSDAQPCEAIKELINSGQKSPFRNPGANLIVQMLRDYCGKNADEIFETLKIYNEHCDPAKDEKILKRDLEEQYKRQYNINCNTLEKFCPYKEDKNKCLKHCILKEAYNLNEIKNIINTLSLKDLSTEGVLLNIAKKNLGALKEELLIDEIHIKTEIPKSILNKTLLSAKDINKKNNDMLNDLQKLAPLIKQDSKNNKTENVLPWIELPKEGKLVSDFADEIAEILRDKNEIFFRPESRDIIEVGEIREKNDDYLGFLVVKPSRFITLAEKYVVPYKTKTVVQRGSVFEKDLEKSMNVDIANIVLSSANLQNKLLKLKRLFHIPIPIIYENKLTFPKKGYDKRFNSWRPYDSPEINKPEMELIEAKQIIDKIFAEFCFTGEKITTNQYRINAIAALLTPFLRGLYPNFNTRTPLFFYLANRERAGKDYCAGITGILYEGFALEEPPISNTEVSRGGDSDELKKKILAAMINGRKRLHFANNKGHIDNSVLEAILTAKKYSDRILGKNDILTFNNEIDFSLSGNAGVSFTPDLANRAVFIRFFLDIENANARKFKNPDLHNWVKNNREEILSAMYSLVRNWIERGMPDGKIPFASFPEWARICGGVMETAGYENPCKLDEEGFLIGGDSETQEMKTLFEECWNEYPEQWIKKSDIRKLLTNKEKECSAFSNMDLNSVSGSTRLGMIILKFTNRILSGIKMKLESSSVKAANQRIMFTKILDEKKTEEKDSNPQTML